MNCGLCRFWVRHDEADGLGFCQAEPPTIISSMVEEGVGYFGIWPVTAAEDWCGRYEAAAVKSATQSR